MRFTIEGWFPPIKFTSLIDGKTYAVCGSKWIEIHESMTYDDILKGWVCTAKDLPKVTVYKKPTKAQLHTKNENKITPNNLIRKLMNNRKIRLEKQPSLF